MPLNIIIVTFLRLMLINKMELIHVVVAVKRALKQRQFNL